MSGHNKWKQIKEKKGVLDKKRSAVFSKLLKAITVVARDGESPDFNPRLKAALERAKQSNVPQENIERAIKKVRERAENLEEILIEAYGPGGAALIIEAITDNRLRTVQEIKIILKDYGGRIAAPGATAWAFELSPDRSRQPKFKQELGGGDKDKLEKLVGELEDHEDVQKVYKNT
ncbi:MAG: YebC/PmpR family DNA-binding transcriptional regulator [Candidatus Jorgensenbacteria bacterium]